jgi:tetratricopeptide (TPR) repeat protein
VTRSSCAVRVAALLVVAALASACSATQNPSLLGIRSNAAELEQSSLEYALRGDLPRALRLEEQALSAYRSVDDTAAITGALNRVGNLRQRTGDASGARAAYLEAQSLAAVTGNRAEEAAARSNLGTLDEEAGDLASADAQYAAARALAEAADADATLATILNNQALLARRQGDAAHAVELLRAALAIDRKRGNDAGVANRLRNLGAIEAARGRRAEAIAALGEALDLDRKRENIPEIALDLVTLSEIHARDPATLALAVSQRRRAAEIHRLLGRDDVVARDEAAIAGWCASLRAAGSASGPPVDCVLAETAGSRAGGAAQGL